MTIHLRKFITAQNIIELLFYVFIFLLPIQTRLILVDTPIAFQNISVYGIDLLLLIIIAVCFLIRARLKLDLTQQDLRTYRLNTAPMVILLLTVVWALVGTVWSPNPDLTLSWAIRLLFAVSIIWVVRNVSINPTRIAMVFIVTMMLQAMLGIGQFLLQDDIIVTKWLGTSAHEAFASGTSVVEISSNQAITTTMAIFPEHAGRWLRAYGTFTDPNMFGGMLVLAILICAYVLRHYESPTRRLRTNGVMLLLMGCIFVNTTALFFTFSRSAWITLAAIFIIWIIYQLRKPFRPLSYIHFMILPALLLIALLVTAYFPLVHTRLNSSSYLEHMSVSERTHGLSESLYIIKQSPIIGHGIGSYTDILTQQHSEYIWYQLSPVHNVFLLILSDMGIIGVLLLGSALALFIRILAIHFFSTHSQLHLFNNSFFLNQPDRTEHKTLVLIIIALGILGVFDHYFWTQPTTFYVVWGIVALIANPHLFHKQTLLPVI